MVETLLTVPEAARVLRVNTARMYELLRENVIPSVSIGRQRRIRPRVLAEFVEGGGKALPGGWRREAPQEPEERPAA